MDRTPTCYICQGVSEATDVPMAHAGPGTKPCHIDCYEEIRVEARAFALEQDQARLERMGW